MTIQEALDKKDAAAWDLVRHAIEFSKAINYEPGREQVAEVIDNYYGEQGSGEEMISELLEKVKTVETADQQFLQSIKDNSIPLQLKIVDIPKS